MVFLNRGMTWSGTFGVRFLMILKNYSLDSSSLVDVFSGISYLRFIGVFLFFFLIKLMTRENFFFSANIMDFWERGFSVNRQS